jgi:hypothetical protein
LAKRRQAVGYGEASTSPLAVELTAWFFLLNRTLALAVAPPGPRAVIPTVWGPEQT